MTNDQAEVGALVGTGAATRGGWADSATAMRKHPSKSLRFIAFAAFALVSLLIAQPGLYAQTTVITVPPPPPQVEPPVIRTGPVVEVVPERVVPPAPPVEPPSLRTTTTTTESTTRILPVPTAPPEVLAPGEHVAEIELAVSRGSVQAYFGRAARRETVGIGPLDLTVKLPSTATVSKLASRDKDSEGAKRVTRDNPWNVRVRFTGPGRYVFNIQEWDNDPVVTVASVRVDGQTLFLGHGSEENIGGWAQATFAPGVVKSGSREIAFVIE